MNPLASVAHFLFQTEAGHFALYVVGSAVISGMPAPTATSGTAYKWLFSTLNILAANISRARSTTVEKSPNFQAAVAAQCSGDAPQAKAANAGPAGQP